MEMDELVERMVVAAGALEAAAEKLAAVEVQASAALDERVTALEASMVGNKNGGRKTISSMVAKEGSALGDGAALDVALQSLSVEQRIAVKAGLLRGGLLG